jgi:predicted RNA binding protein YcfA (HicA-like mRNA interferase family)
MKRRDLVKLLLEAGFVSKEGKGDHEKWAHPLLKRPVTITQTREVSPGVTRIVLNAIDEVRYMS